MCIIDYYRFDKVIMICKLNNSHVDVCKGSTKYFRSILSWSLYGSFDRDKANDYDCLQSWKESWKESQKKIGLYPFFVKIWEIDLPLSR